MNLLLDAVNFSYRSKTFPPRQVFNRLNLTVASGECVAVTGEEGSGKSTLLQIIAGLQKPDSGKVLIGGKDMWQNPKRQHEIRRTMGFAFQFPEQQFFCETIENELMFAVRNFQLQDGRAKERCIAALGELGLSESFLLRSPFSLSMGEARRVALASLLLHQPATFLLDEPTAGLDAFGIHAVTTLLLGLKSQGKTILFASHEEALASTVASRVVVLGEGRVKNDSAATLIPTEGL